MRSRPSFAGALYTVVDGEEAATVVVSGDVEVLDDEQADATNARAPNTIDVVKDLCVIPRAYVPPKFPFDADQKIRVR